MVHVQSSQQWKLGLFLYLAVNIVELYGFPIALFFFPFDVVTARMRRDEDNFTPLHIATHDGACVDKG